MVHGVPRKCNTTWMIEVKVQGKFLGMRTIRGQEVEGRDLDGVVRARNQESLCQKPSRDGSK